MLLIAVFLVPFLADYYYYFLSFLFVVFALDSIRDEMLSGIYVFS